MTRFTPDDIVRLRAMATQIRERLGISPSIVEAVDAMGAEDGLPDVAEWLDDLADRVDLPEETADYGLSERGVG